MFGRLSMGLCWPTRGTIMLYSLLITSSATVCVLLAAWGYRQRAIRGALVFSSMMLGVAAWSLGCALELINTSLPAKVFWAKLEYVGIVSVPVIWLVFALAYIGHDRWLTRRRLALLFAPALATLALVWTNEAHHLIWRTVELVPRGDLVGWQASYGAGFWVFTLYSYTLLLVGTALLVRFALLSSDLYRSQSWGIVVATVVPWLGNLIYNSGLNPLPGIELAPLTFALTGVVFALVVFRWQLLDIMPVAHDCVFESIGDAVLVLDPGRRVVAANGEARRVAGLAGAALVGRALEQALERQPALRGLIEQALERGPAAALQEIGLEVEGHPTTYHLQIAPLQRWSGALGGSLVVLHDITPTKQAEQELRRARDAAEAASLAKSTFLATMSHELRTPLTSVMGFSQLLSRDPEVSAEQRECLEIINRSGEHLLTLINDVLDMAKIEAGQMQVLEMPVDLRALLEDLRDLFALRSGRKGLALEVGLAGDLPQRIWADERRLRQVLINLLGNAVKFTERGVVRLWVQAEPAQPGQAGPRCRFLVEDTGVGIAGQQLEQIFEPFCQVADGQTIREGTGLGLTISRGFARMMGGDLSVESRQGQGSCFTLELPLRAVVESRAPGAKAEELVVGLETGSPPCRMLVVDDNPDIRRLLVRLLAPLGFELREAADGAEALALAQSWPPHLVWMDLHMPLLNGAETARRMKAELSPAPVVIALTASIVADEHSAAQAAGCDDLLCKPVRPRQLLETAQRWLGLRYRYAPADSLAAPAPAVFEAGLDVAAGSR
jgi:PAS domain S-box-containing protein